MKPLRKRKLLRIAVLCWTLFGLATLLGLREYVCVLSFTSPDGGAISLLDIFCMLVYVLLFAAATTLAPIFAIASGMDILAERLKPNRFES